MQCVTQRNDEIEKQRCIQNLVKNVYGVFIIKMMEYVHSQSHSDQVNMLQRIKNLPSDRYFDNCKIFCQLEK